MQSRGVGSTEARRCCVQNACTANARGAATQLGSPLEKQSAHSVRCRHGGEGPWPRSREKEVENGKAREEQPAAASFAAPTQATMDRAKRSEEDHSTKDRISPRAGFTAGGAPPSLRRAAFFVRRAASMRMLRSRVSIDGTNGWLAELISIGVA